MLDAGLAVTINSDDPAYFGGYVGANYRDTCAALALTREEAVAIARNGLVASFVDAPTRDRFLARLEAAVAAG